MKRNIVLILSMCLILFTLVAGIVYLNNPDGFVKDNHPNESETRRPQIIEYRVVRGEVTHTYEVDGRVVSNMPDLYVETITVDENGKKIELLKKKGDLIDASEVLYVYDGKEYRIDYNGKIVDINQNKTDNANTFIIRVLNFDKLYIITNINQDKLSKIKYDTNVRITANGQTADSKVLNIGYEIMNESISVCVSSMPGILPGTKVKLVFTLDVQPSCLYVALPAVYQDGDRYYATVETPSGFEQRLLVTGQQFSVEENGYIFNYIEILSGVSEGDKLIVEEYDYTETPLSGGH